MISDIGKIGTLIEAARDMKEDVNAAPTFSIRTLLGRRDDPVLQVYARRLIESIALAPVNTGSSRSLLLGIALQSNSPATLRAVVQQIEQQKLW
ncbi:hypothetical protein CAOG_00264 [Capsaspora owczarzaki ATCC 30864]|uniref:Uncharacterized protein n=1 Tax=Capsaspora owczarzaki (strain ATCC 30864) TaxID=595528 RepID=A0A0D2WGS9_CAPO3|nr:hypothetical protein CAOG_00264 [Capsaspora owczarzaki ATCC 30864]KJE88655.1 hypothetical protein CAOG_000264 [Capsaspora owczarzaki ATCC 30864]|eukprot:XP_004365135.2 hypothetical protein CAOG_00264 [Capsaspora owczarzaki ATCC 30864]